MAATTESGPVCRGDHCMLFLRFALGVWALIGGAIVGAGHLHLRWLPSHGINGWTGEPKEKYYELIEATRSGHPKLRAFVPSATEKPSPKS